VSRFSRAVGVLALAAGVVVAAAGASQRTAVPPRISPAPQQVVRRTEQLAIPSRVRIVTTAHSDSSAVAAVTQILSAIHVTPTTSTAAKLTIYVGRNYAAERQLATRTSRGLPADGYVLVAGRGIDGKARIVLDGVDNAGQYYAAQTLGQLLKSHRLQGVAIRDWPSFASRGVVEGFYGPPWSETERLSMLDFMGAHKLNLYMFAPKDDAYLRAKWRVPFPASYLTMLHTLVVRAAEDHVAFNLMLSPGLSICYTSANDRKALIAKLQAAWDAGVRSFTIGLDDIDFDRPLCAGDAAQGTGEAELGHLQSTLLNAVDRQFIAKHPGAAPLILVPSEYSGDIGTPYTEAVAEDLAPDVIVEWTGRYGVSVVISQGDVDAAQSMFEHPLIVWDNSFVTDYGRQYLALGPLDRHDPTLGASLDGIVADPMALPEASKLPLFTMADYSWNSVAYNPQASWQASVVEFAGGNVQTKRALAAFSDANWGSLLNPVQAPTLSSEIATFWAGWSAGDPSAAPTLNAQLALLANAPNILQARLGNREFITETAPWLTATATWAEAARQALATLVARADGNTSAAATSAQTTQLLAEKGQALGVGPSAVTVSGGILQQFVQDASSGTPPGGVSPSAP
jgi:hyaluronoglucosaminidase